MAVIFLIKAIVCLSPPGCEKKYKGTVKGRFQSIGIAFRIRKKHIAELPAEE